MRVVFASQRIEFTTGYRIDMEKWDADKQRVRNGCTNKLKQSASEINTELLTSIHRDTECVQGVRSTRHNAHPCTNQRGFQSKNERRKGREPS